MKQGRSRELCFYSNRSFPGIAGTYVIDYKLTAMLYEIWMQIYCMQIPRLQRWKGQVQTVVPYFDSALPYQFDSFLFTKSGVIFSSVPVNMVCECSLAFLSAGSCDFLFSMKPFWIVFLTSFGEKWPNLAKWP